MRNSSRRTSGLNLYSIERNILVGHLFNWPLKLPAKLEQTTFGFLLFPDTVRADIPCDSFVYLRMSSAPVVISFWRLKRIDMLALIHMLISNVVNNYLDNNVNIIYYGGPITWKLVLCWNGFHFVCSKVTGNWRHMHCVTWSRDCLADSIIYM